jgi:hypothetical protein
MNHLVDIGGAVVGFLIFKILINIIVAHWIADKVVRLSKDEIQRNKRVGAIFSHFLQDHPGNKADDVANCGTGKCAIFS